jgi:lysophospholipid acyltransferase (LPLAT)-like uncharacterized protein
MRASPKTREIMLQFLSEHLGPAVVKSLGHTLRVRRVGSDNIGKAREIAGSTILACWHGRLLPLIYVHRDEGINALVSTHQDGEYIARIIHGLGFGTSRGSSTRGGVRALRALIEAASRDLDIAVTPDGPRGPREKVQPGVVYLAKRLGLPVIPIGASGNPSILLGSWDRFMVPLPLARCAVVYGEPVVYDGTVSEEALASATADLGRRLCTVTHEADHVCGR